MSIGGNTFCQDPSVTPLLDAASYMLVLQVGQQVRFDPPVQDQVFLDLIIADSEMEWIYYYLDKPTKWWQRRGGNGQEIVAATRVK